MKLSLHTHPESSLTASTLPNLIKRAKALRREYFSHTDSGHLGAAMKSYTLAKKAGLKPILGVEFYFRDEGCPYVSGTKADRIKYYQATIYAQNQEAYQEIVKQVSRTDLPTIEVYGEAQTLWNWASLAHLANFKTSLVLCGPNCIVSKNHLAGETKIALSVFQKLHSLFGENLSVALLAEPWDKKFASIVKVEYVGGGHSSVLSSDIVTTNKARRIRASDLLERSGHTHIESYVSSFTYNQVGKEIKKVSLHKGFLPLPLDITLSVNKLLLALAKRYSVPILVTDYAYYAEPEDRIVQDVVLEGKTKLKSSLHMRSSDEIGYYLEKTMGLTWEEAGQIIDNNAQWAKKFDSFELKYQWRIADPGGEPLPLIMKKIRELGRMKWEDKNYVERLKEELQVIAKNGVNDLSAYFLPIADVMQHYRDIGKLTGPSRGSAGGCMVAYLLGITQVDPIQWDLSFPRFLSLDRVKNGDWVDIDMDFGTRVPLVGEDGKSGYLYGRWGNKVAQISTRHTVRLKSAVKDVNRYFNGSVEESIEKFSKNLPEPPQGIQDSQFVFGYEDSDGNHVDGLIEVSEDLKKYAAERPKEWAIVQRALGLVRSNSQHASAFIVTNTAVSDIVPTRDGNVAQYEAKQVEACGLLKLDFLVVLNLNDIEGCLNLINKKNGEILPIGYFTHKSKQEYIWNLPEDLEAYMSTWDGDTAALFQVGTKSMNPFVKSLMPKCVLDYSDLVAVVRPGTMDAVHVPTGKSMAEEYVSRKRGESEPDFPELYELIPETKGVIIYQEQSSKIAKELGGMSGPDAETLRRLFSKKLNKEANEMKPVFMKTAVPKIGEEKALLIWDMMEASSRYSFNKSHSLAYGLITYAGTFLRHNYNLEYWTAVLSNAKESEISGSLWPHVKDLIASPDINLSTEEMVIDYANNKIRAKLGIIRGMGDKTIDPIVAGRPYKDIEDYVDKRVAGQSLTHRLIHVGVLDSLFPAKSSLHSKLKAYEQAVENRYFQDKKTKADAKGSKMRATEPKEGKVPEAYLNLHPIKDAAMKKATLPSMLISTYHLGAYFSRVLVESYDKPKVKSARGYETPLLTGEELVALAEMDGEQVDKDIYVAATCYIVKTEEFDYAKNTKKAFKFTGDFDSFNLELVLWPDYESGQLIYDPKVAKGAIVTVFLRKRKGKKDLSVSEFVVES